MVKKMFSDWIQQQYEQLKANLPSEEIEVGEQTLEGGVQELLELVSEYMGLTPVQFIVSRIKIDLEPYKTDLRFGRWLTIHLVNR